MARRRRRRSADQVYGSRPRSHAGAFADFSDATDYPESWSVPRVVAVSPTHDFDRLPSLYLEPGPVVGLFSSQPAPEFAPGSTRLRLLAVPKGVVTPKARDRGQALSVLQVHRPEVVSQCVRRKERKSVLFAEGVAGRRGSAPGPYRRNVFSSYRC